MSLFKRLYGGGPGHLVIHLLAFALVLWSAVQIFHIGGSLTILIWLVAAVILHDGIGLPIYAALDRGLQEGVAVAEHDARGGVRVLNHIRVPLSLSAVSFLVFSPLLLDKSAPALERTSTLVPEGYLGRWVLVVVVLFAVSALLYLVRVHNASEGGGSVEG